MATKAQEARINKLLAKWKERLLLQHWAITVTYAEKDKHSERSETGPAAEIIVDSRYTEARMTLYPNLFKRPVAYQEVTIVHELIHIITDATRDVLLKAVNKKVLPYSKLEDLNENLTEHFAKIVYKSYKRNSKPNRYHL